MWYNNKDEDNNANINRANLDASSEQRHRVIHETTQNYPSKINTITARFVVTCVRSVFHIVLLLFILVSIHHYKYLPLNVYVGFYCFRYFYFYLSAIKAMPNKCNFGNIKIHEFKILHCSAEGNSQYQTGLRDRFGFRMDCRWMDDCKIFHLMIWITNMKNGLRSWKANHKQIHLENKVGAYLYIVWLHTHLGKSKKMQKCVVRPLMWFVCYKNELVLNIMITVNIKLYDILKDMCCFLYLVFQIQI